jgi:Predicted aminopeptidases
MKQIIYIFALLFAFASCGAKTEKPTSQTKPEEAKRIVPEFNADSAYYYTDVQVAFGPRVPNTDAHKKGGDYLAGELRRHGASVVEQEAVVYTYDGIKLNIKNIIGSFAPEKQGRILLCAHWDSRPFADHDPDPKNHKTPIDGANDGAGACGALLEIARHMGKNQPNVGIDIIFFDAEDWGSPSFEENYAGGYCLGSEYWSSNPHILGYRATYGILLDMVSAPDARFYREGYSNYYAKEVVDKVWKAGHDLGYGHFFVNEVGGAIEDDHVHILKNLKIPCIDIIQHDNTTDTGFGAYWHTLQDNMEQVSKETLKIAGQTVLHVIYHE